MSETNGNGWRNRIVGHGEKSADQFQAHPRNWRQHPEAQRKALAASLNGVGWVDTVIENVTTGHLIDGHERIWQALDQGDNTPVPFTQVELSEDEEHLVLATFDSITQMAVTDGEALEDLLSDLRVSDLVVDMPDLDALLHEVAARADVAYGEFVDAGDDPGADIDRAEELREKWQTERGQVWEVPSVTTQGKAHRVMCGDSTSADDVGRLMDGERADITHADPPYGIELLKERARLGKSKEYSPVQGDDKPFDPRPFLDFADSTIMWGSNHFANLLPPSPFWLVWDKQGGAKDTTFATCELAWCNVHKPARVITHIWDGFRRDSEKGEDRFHPTQKPVEVIKWALSWLDGVTVYDPFLGSGTTAVAAEQTGRLCYGMEISEKYVAVTLERLAGMGLEPRLTS